MNHVAIDLGSKHSQVCIRGGDGTLIREFKHATRSLRALMPSWAPGRVILETSAEAFAIADQALGAGLEVRVVPATLVKSLGVGLRGIKTDQRDARTLSEVSCRIDLPSVHIPSTFSRELKSICGSRETLLAARTQLVNNVRGWLRTTLGRIRRGSPATFPDRVRGQSETEKSPLPPHIERELIVIDELNRQIRGADRHLRAVAKANPVCQRLMTAPGVGPVTAVRYLAALDDVTRFRTAHAVASYLGLTPGEHSSAESQHRTGITKAGSRAVRRTLVQAAWAALRAQPKEPMTQWAAQIAARRGKFIAVVALARKIAGILFAMWRDGTTYRSRHATPQQN